MDQPHEDHLKKLKETIVDLVDAKYRKGQTEHGGNLWAKPALLDEAINEVVDLAVYLLTLKDQIEDLKTEYNVEKIANDYSATFEGLR